MKRREFVEKLGVAMGGLALAGRLSGDEASKVGPEGDQDELFTLSLSQWAFHRSIFGNARDHYETFIHTLHTNPDGVLLGDMDPRDIVVRARELDVGFVDLVNILWFGHGKDKPWLRDFRTLAANEGVGFGVLMCDETGKLGAKGKAARSDSVAKHVEWMETAVELGCPFIRVNPYGDGNYLEQCQRCSESLQKLGEISADFDLEVLVENHGHPGGTGAWMAMLMEMTDHPRVGIYADFDNFFMGGWGLVPERRYDRHQGMLDLAPYTKAVSAKSHDFDDDGKETKIDFNECLRTVLDAGFRGLVCAEFEGERLSELEGSRMTVELLRRERAALSSRY